MYSITRRLSLPMLIASAAMIAACKDSDTAPLVEQAAPAIRGDSQTVMVGSMTASPLVVRVISTTGAFMPGVTVTWSVLQGTGALSSTSSVTDSAGVAEVNFTPDAAGTDIVGASVPNVSTMTDFTVLATAATSPTAPSDSSASLPTDTTVSEKISTR